MTELVKSRRKAAVDILIILLCLALGGILYIPYMQFANKLPIVVKMLHIMLIEFCGAGLAVFIIVYFRKETLVKYGVQRFNINNSLLMGASATLVFGVIRCLDAGELLWIPMRNHTAMKISILLPFPFNLLGIVLTLFIWGTLEALYFVVFAEKLEQLVGITPKSVWLSPGVIAFALWNPVLHIVVRIVEGRITGIDPLGLILSFLGSYTLIMIYKLTKNSSGSMLMQTILNGLGRL